MNTILSFGLPGGPEWIIILIFAVLPTIFWIWALIDVLKSEFTDSSNKVIWLLVVILLPLLGSILYYFLGRNQRVTPH